ncbi:hypothetical protein [Rhodoferax sp.]|uniref:hypothetical protein n=1 Tax=Rhodoferax sp. TaxID=50421 RepID=UPI002ACE32CE|nr:hypothetical protein [Rhodoferax sp.]MDZ7921666.1 hypothetical protein [Rhodoferax sp.]
MWLPRSRKIISVRAEQKNFVLGYNPPMFAACLLSLSIVFAAMASKGARASITKTTTIKG